MSMGTNRRPAVSTSPAKKSRRRELLRWCISRCRVHHPDAGSDASGRQISDSFAFFVILTTGALATGGTDLGQLRVVRHPDDRSDASGRQILDSFALFVVPTTGATRAAGRSRTASRCSSSRRRERHERPADLGQLRAVCHPDDGSVSDGRNGSRTASRTRSRFRSPSRRIHSRLETLNRAVRPTNT